MAFLGSKSELAKVQYIINIAQTEDDEQAGLWFFHLSF
jgi:hypothetical protein